MERDARVGGLRVREEKWISVKSGALVLGRTKARRRGVRFGGEAHKSVHLYILINFNILDAMTKSFSRLKVVSIDFSDDQDFSTLIFMISHSSC